MFTAISCLVSSKVIKETYISCNINELKQCINTRQITKMSNSTWQHADNSGYHADPWPIKICHSNDDLTAQLYLKFLLVAKHEVPFINTSEAQAPPSSKYVVYATACVYRELSGKSPIVKKTFVNNYLIWNKVFLPQMYCKLVSCADFKAILMPFREVVWNRYSSF